MNPSTFRRHINWVIVMILLSTSPAAQARKRSYHFKTITESKSRPESTLKAAIVTDIVPDSAALRQIFTKGEIIPAGKLSPAEIPVFSGFDKRLNNSKESFFIINNTSKVIEGVVVELTYHTPDGRMLHHRNAIIPVRIPAGETRNIAIPAWDTQRSFYYLKSETTPKHGNPFDITLTHLFIIY